MKVIIYRNPKPGFFHKKYLKCISHEKISDDLFLTPFSLFFKVSVSRGRSKSLRILIFPVIWGGGSSPLSFPREAFCMLFMHDCFLLWQHEPVSWRFCTISTFQTFSNHPSIAKLRFNIRTNVFQYIYKRPYILFVQICEICNFAGCNSLSACDKKTKVIYEL